MINQQNEQILRTITIELKKPIRIYTRKYGTLELRRLSFGDLVFIEEQLNREQAVREFIIRIISKQLTSPKFTIREIRSWENRLLIRVAWKWLVQANINRGKPESLKVNFVIVRDTIADYAAEQRRSLQSAAENIQKSFSKIDSPINQLKLMGNVQSDLISKTGIEIQEYFKSINEVHSFAGQSFKLLDSSIHAQQRLVEPIIRDMGKGLNSSVMDLMQSANLSMMDIAKSLTPQTIALGESLRVTNMIEASAFAQASLPKFALAEFGSIINLQKEAKSSLAHSLHELTDSYSNLLKFEKGTLPELFSLPKQISVLPPIEYFHTANLAEIISVKSTERHLEKEERTFTNTLSSDSAQKLGSLLAELDANLINMWQGASEARKSRNPDRIRHFAVSLRELFTQVLHSLAPDGKVKAWTDSPNHYHEGKPTREARLLYICREINSRPFDRFVEFDIHSIIEFLKIFQTGTHETVAEFSDEQLDVLQVKMENTLRFLLEIGKLSK